MNNNKRLLDGKKNLVRGLILNILLSAFKFTAGILGKSQAMIADAIHSLSDTVTDIVVLLGLFFGSKPKDKTHPYGHGKFETITAVFISIALLIVAFNLGSSAVKSLLSKTIHKPGGIVILAAIISIITKEALYRYTLSCGKKINSLAFIANAWHHRSDALSSVIVLIGVTAAHFGIPFCDPLAALAVCIFITKVSFDIMKLSFTELVEGSVDTEIIEKIKNIAVSQPKVLSVHGIKARKIGPKIYAEAHLVLNPSMSLLEAHTIAAKTENDIISQLKEIDEVLIHTDPANRNNFYISE
ncbi:MAG: cation diffusion facilitator family transporter [Candidatus Omnitrophota bacterium]